MAAPFPDRPAAAEAETGRSSQPDSTLTVSGKTGAVQLDGARTALERESVSVNKAAHRAGFTSAANFATAFRRQFGAPPESTASAELSRNIPNVSPHFSD
jgi:AraC-like DNA-binding protein